VEGETEEELRAHVQHRADDLERLGMTRTEAERRARIEFGGHESFKEECREALSTRILEVFLQDLRFSFRMLRKSPGFAAVAILTLALGIGANTAIFTLLDQILLRSLPVQDPQQLVLLDLVGHPYGNSSGDSVLSYPMYRDLQEHNEVFSGMFGHRSTTTSLSFGVQAERVRVELVSGTYFSVLGVRPALGRALTPEADQVPNGEPLVVLNYAFWKERWGGDLGIVGKTLLVNNRNLTVVGVAQAGFDGVEADRAANLFVPIMMQEAFMGERKTPLLTDRRTRWMQAFGRLKPGATIEQAKAALQPLTHAMLEMEVKQPAFNHASAYDREEFLKSWMNVLPGSKGFSYTRNDLTTPLWVLMATTGLVLLIACGNLANLLLSRAAGPQKEIGVRLAIGASRGRILHQLLIESLVLSALGGLAGLALAFWADQALMAAYLGADTTALNISAAPDARILLFTLSVTLVTGIAFGFAPALQSTKTDLNSCLKDESSSVVRGGRDFTPQDGIPLKKSPDKDEEESATAVVINETLARRYFAGRNPIGLHLGFGTDPGTKTNMEIVGVAKDTKYTGLRDDIPEEAFLPYLAAGFTGQSRMTAYLRTVGDPAPVMRAAREKVRQMDARLPITAMRTMEEQITGSLSAERMIASLSSVFRLLAALLATIELYGVMAYAVARRTREIGIRIALGAETRSVQWMVMRQVSLLVTAGLAVGIPAALALARLGRQWISGMFYGVPPSDPANFVLAALLMAGVALLAGFLPARRASRVDPIVALRHE